MKTLIKNLIKKTCHAELVSASQVAPSSDTSCHLLPPMGRRQFSFAFTLAEVLITLGIIGVVAALTMPSLIENYQKRQAVSQLKVAYSLLSQAINQSVAENGEINSWDYSLSHEDFNKKYIMPYLKVVKVLKRCSGPSCESILQKLNYIYVLNNGMIIAYNPRDLHGDHNTFIVFAVDINGTKGKNEFGKDIFYFHLLHHNLSEPAERRTVSQYSPGLYIGSYDYLGVPHMARDRDILLGQAPSNFSYLCTKENPNKEACAAVIAKDGWQIAPDYPW